MVTIYGSDGIAKAEIEADDNSTQAKEIQAGNTLSLSFTLYRHVAFDVNDYTDFEGERYWLMDAAQPRQKSTMEWEYNLVFYGIENLMKRFLVINDTDGDCNPVFSLTAPPREHAALVVRSINTGMGTADWKVGTVEGVENITIDYEGKYCDEALAKIAKAVGTEYWAEGQTVNVCRCEHGEEVSLGYGKGLLNLEQDTADNVPFYTRLFPVGSSKNIDPEKYGHSRLQLPGGEKYADIAGLVEKYGIFHHYESSAFADIYPKRIGTVSSVRSVEATGEDGEPYKIFYFKDSGLDFDPNDYELPQKIKRVSFQEGSELAGIGQEENGTYYLEVNYHSDTKEFEIITVWPFDDDTQLPNDTLCPKTGDKYILWNIRMPDEYYALAEQEYQAAVEQYNADNALDVSRYKAATDHVYIEDNRINLFVGRRVKLESREFFPETGYRCSRITKLTRRVNLPSSVELEISDALSTGGKTSLQNDITGVRTEIKSLSKSISLPDLIKVGDNTLPTDNNLYSARRTNKEIMKRALSRDYDDETKGMIRFLAGIEIGKYIPDAQGGKIDAAGVSELCSLLLRAGLVVRSGGTMPAKALAHALQEEDNVEGLARTIQEENDISGMSNALQEEVQQEVANTLGNLDNVDASFDDVEDGDYVLSMKGGLFFPVKAANIGGGSTVIRLSFATSGVLTVAEGGTALIEYNFSSTLDGESTGPGTAAYTVNDRKVYSGTVNQGKTSFDVAKWLKKGENTVIVEVTDSYGNMRKLSYSVTVVSISISSTFSAMQVFSGSVNYKFTPVGAVEKTVHFILDGSEIGTMQTTASNRQQTYSIPAQAHGAHTLEVYMTAEIGGYTVESNRLYYELACIEEGNMEPVIVAAFKSGEVEQYATLVIPYLVYDPATSVAEVVLAADGETVSELSVPRTEQQWSYRVRTQGQTVLSIACGTTVKTLELTVTPSEITSEATTADLELFLTSTGRSNAENNRSEWKYGDIAAILTGFNYSTNGWVQDASGNTVLRVSGSARVEIPFRIFANDIRINGKTIEIEFATSNVTDYDETILSCWNNKGIRITAQKAVFASEQTRVEAQYKEEERVRVSFVIEETAENRLIYTYINGIASGTVQYPSGDSFTHVDPAGITIGSENCTVDIYNIRVYGNNLNPLQVLENYIADMDDMEKKLALFRRNQVYDDYGALLYDRLLEQLPCMTIVGSLPNFKGDKKTVKIIFEDAQHPERSFVSENVQIDVQGTSSQYYPRKNYKTKHKGGFLMTESGEQAEAFHLREGDIAVDCFCEKADFAESSGTHNTGMAKIIDRALKALGFLTPPQREDSRVRTTVDGDPIVMFHQETEGDEAVFLGKYNFNNDKSTQETFGFSGDNECWEFLNNTSNRVLFLESDYARKDSGGKPEWMSDFEARYPDDDDINAGYEAGNIPEKLKRVTDWIVSTKDNPGKFKAECADYFDVDMLLAYYIFTELFGMVDQRAKNMFFATWDGTHWAPIFYDNDTCLGINNEGAIAFNYNIEYGDAIGSQNVWNGSNSTLWNNVMAAFPNEIAALYQRIRAEGILSYESVIGILNSEQSDRWCESVYNEDGQFKYISPLVDGFFDYGTNEFVHTDAYLYALQGSRSDHRKWWLFNRFRYMDSKYNAGNYVSDFATMRLYTPESWQGVEPDGDFTIVPYADQYLKVKYGSYGTQGVRAERGKETVIEAPAGQTLNDTETIIYGASRLASLGNLSGKYAGTVDVSKAVKLEELMIGSHVEGYRNTNLKTLAIGNNKMLRRLNVENCPSLTQALNLEGCENIEEVYAEGSAITGVNLAAGGNLKEFHLPETVRNLNLRNQPSLMEGGFSIAGVGALTTLVLENTGIDTFALLTRCLALSPVVLERVRLVGVSGSSNDTEKLLGLIGMAGVDENGNDIPEAVVTGELHAGSIGIVVYERLREAFRELSIVADMMYIEFQDPEAESVCIKNYDKDKDGHVSLEEAESVKAMSNTFRYNKTIEAFDEFVYFKNVTKITGVFDGCTNLKQVALPESLQEIGERAFINCGIRAVDIPETVEVIGGSAFAVCGNLTGIILPASLAALETSAFSQCSALEKIEIPDTVTKIGSSVFSRCSNLSQVTLPENIQSIPNSMFYECKKLKQIDIPGKIVKIGDSAFYLCSALEEITFPDSLKAISGSAFRSCSLLSSIQLPDGLETIGNYAFNGCSKLRQVVLPGNIISLGTNVFEDCKELTEATFSGEVSSIPDAMFKGCLNLQQIGMPGKVVEIGSYAFAACSALEQVALSDTLVSIGAYAFQSCSSLLAIQFPDSLETIGNGAFQTCSGLQQVSIPNNVHVLGNSVFSGCSNLQQVRLPENMSSIPNSLFAGCSKLQQITLPGNAEALGDTVFSGCSKLEQVMLPARLKTIGFRAFLNCKALASIQLPDALESLADRVFEGCSALRAMTIPGSVKSLGDYTFQSCSALDYFVFLGTEPPTVGSHFLPNTVPDIYVPDGAFETYETAFSGLGYSYNLKRMSEFNEEEN